MVLFVGYPRSGHTLIGSLLDAHPNIIISDEMRVFLTWKRFSKKDKTRDNIFQAMYANSAGVSKFGERSSRECTSMIGGYVYKVPNQWQGRFDKVIQVLHYICYLCMHILPFFLSGTDMSIMDHFELAATANCECLGERHVKFVQLNIK